MLNLNLDVSYESWISVTGMEDPRNNYDTERITGSRTINAVVESGWSYIQSLFCDREVDFVIMDEIWGKFPMLAALVATHTDLKHGLSKSPGVYIYRVYPIYNNADVQIKAYLKIKSVFINSEEKPVITEEAHHTSSGSSVSSK